jgi:hypothetical protein
MRGLTRPAGHVSGAEVGGVDLLAGDLRPAFDAAASDGWRGLPRRAAGGLSAGRSGNRLGEATERANRDRNAGDERHAEEASTIHAEAG